METMLLDSSSEDDDVYLNSVAKLKALKTMPMPTPSNSNNLKKEEKKLESSEDLKIKASQISYMLTVVSPPAMPQRPNRKTAGKRNASKRRGPRTRQRKNEAESDSDLEIVSVEKKLNSSENDLLIVEDKLDEDFHNSEDENYEISIKILWQSKDIHRLTILRNENFQSIFEYFANLEQVSIHEVLITKQDKNVERSDTPASINLTVIDILEGGIIKRDGTSQKNSGGKIDENACIIKVQTTSKKRLTIHVRRDDSFKSLLEKCAQELNTEESKIKLYFDGELVTMTDTPESLDIEDEACFDLKLS